LKGGEEIQENKVALAFRVFQLICSTFFITGFIWASSDWLLLTVLVKAPVTPVSVLMMLYSSIGIAGSELAVRMARRQQKK